VAISKRVRTAVTTVFPKPDADTVLQILARYKGPETERVHLAILALSGPDPEEVKRRVGQARGDYRDILLWAEEPEEAGTGTRAEMAARYRALGVPVPTELR
jgi:hypothetical protein